MRLSRFLCASALLCLIGLVACGGDDSDSDGASGASGAAGAGGGGGGQGGGQQCDEQACITCFDGGDEDCADECRGCDDGESGGGGTSGAGSSGPQPECATEHDCGISQECVSCELTAHEGFCVFSEECHFDDDCGAGNKCGYNVETSEYRCIPSAKCP